MSLQTLRKGEQSATNLMRQLKQEILSDISVLETSSLASPSVRRNIVNRTKQKSGRAVTEAFTDVINKSWDDGVSRATREMKMIDPSYMLRQTSDNIDTVEYRMDSLLSSIGSDVAVMIKQYKGEPRMLARAIARKFTEYEQRARGIINFEIKSVESEARSKRISEGHKQMTQRIKQGTGDPKQKKKSKDGLSAMTVKEWNHAGEGKPRPNHVAMHGKAVPEDIPFQLRGADGTLYRPRRPRDENVLPVGETANCGCEEDSFVVWVTENQDKAIRKLAYKTGGILNIKSVIKSLPK